MCTIVKRDPLKETVGKNVYNCKEIPFERNCWKECVHMPSETGGNNVYRPT